jgi:hypothetical protein
VKDCPICGGGHPRKGPFRYRVIGRFHDRSDPQELASSQHERGAKELLEKLKSWPAIDPDSLTINDSLA